MTIYDSLLLRKQNGEALELRQIPIETLRALYVVENRSNSEIAALFNTTIERVTERRRRLGISLFEQVEVGAAKDNDAAARLRLNSNTNLPGPVASAQPEAVGTVYRKLVRDRIPELIAGQGKRCATKVLAEAEFAQALDQKLQEELAEYLADGSLAELADLVEVVRAIVAIKGVTWEDFERLRLEKREQRGGFERRLWLEKTLD